METFDKLCPPQLIVKRNDTEHWREIRLSHWPPGITSKVFFRGIEDWQALGSEEYGFVIVDEAGETSRNAAIMLLTRLRHRLPRKVEEAYKLKEQQTGIKQGLKYVFLALSNPYPGYFEEWFFRGELYAALEAAA